MITLFGSLSLISLTIFSHSFLISNPTIAIRSLRLSKGIQRASLLAPVRHGAKGPGAQERGILFAFYPSASSGTIYDSDSISST